MFEFEGATPKQANNCQKTRINKTKSDTFIPDFTHMYVRRAKIKYNKEAEDIQFPKSVILLLFIWLY